MEPETVSFEADLRRAFGTLECPALTASRRREIMLHAKAQGARGRRRRALFAAFAFAAAACLMIAFLFFGGKTRAPSAGDETLYIAGAHQRVASYGRLTVFKNSVGEMVECREFEMVFDPHFEAMRAAQSVAHYFRDRDFYPPLVKIYTLPKQQQDDE